MQDSNTLTKGRSLSRPDPRSDLDVAPPRPWLQDTWLWILLVGPLLAPIFMATELSVLRPFAEGIYFIGEAVCPKVGVHFMVLDYPMAVCSSCWFAVVGLWTVRLLYGRAGEGPSLYGHLHDYETLRCMREYPTTPLVSKLGQALPLDLRLSITLLAFVPWALDVMLWDTGLWQSPHAFMMFAGYLGGIGAGLLLFPAAAAMRARLANG